MKLLNGTVVLGERHDKPAARAIIADLLIARVVTRLFLELNDLGALGEEEFLFVLKLLDKKHGNSISLETLLTIAAFNHVPVVGYDNASNDEGRFKPTTSEGMANRNLEMGRALTAQGGPGALALVGSFHLYPKHSGGDFSTTLQTYGNIAFSHAIDLSRY
ncbi:MAG: hypothetical protein KIS78_04150 [Labilithrix sp.]|nr:hypothetical protein [Labilithrix sp.]MCW5831630.1 hypothetical protein [Labilithrix sp.]